jgi:hypothetical protein
LEITKLKGGSDMPTLFAVYNLKTDKNIEEYDTDKVLASAVSEPEGELPADSPYRYIAKIEVSDLDAMVSFLGTDAGKEFVKSWSVYVDPTAFFTMGNEI